MSNPVVAALVAIVAAVASAGWWVWLARRGVRTMQGAIIQVRGSWAWGIAAISAILAGSTQLLLTGRAWPWWSVLAIVGVVAAAVDEAHQLLPTRILRVGWVLTAIGTLAHLVTTTPGDLRWLLGRMGIGGLVGAGAYAVAWRIGHGGVGFGDVRFAGLVGALTATTSLTTMTIALFAGTVVGLVRHLVVAIRHRSTRPQPMGSAILAGAWIAALATATSLPLP